MKRNRIGGVVIHGAENIDPGAHSDQVNKFHVQVIERRLNQLPLTLEQKIAVIDKIIEDLKSRDEGGAIK